MKKLMFSAVALIAFSFAGMANTGGEISLNNDVVLNVEKQVTEKVVVKAMWNKCDQLAQDVWDAYKDAGMSDTSAGNASSAAYKECIK